MQDVPVGFQDWDRRNKKFEWLQRLYDSYDMFYEDPNLIGSGVSMNMAGTAILLLKEGRL